MNSHVSAILLGVKDMERSKRFYVDGLGWKVESDYKISVFFVPHGGSLVGFYGREGLADMVGVSPDGSGFSGVVFNYVVRSEARVDEVMEEAKKAGAKILKPAAKLQWGGYGGSFADPDGYIWNIGYSAAGRGSALRRVTATVTTHSNGAADRALDRRARCATFGGATGGFSSGCCSARGSSTCRSGRPRLPLLYGHVRRACCRC